VASSKDKSKDTTPTKDPSPTLEAPLEAQPDVPLEPQDDDTTSKDTGEDSPSFFARMTR